jgi:hypothetical protein
VSFGNPSAANVPPLPDHNPQRHGFRPWSLDPSRCRVMLRVVTSTGTGYTHCARTWDQHAKGVER